MALEEYIEKRSEGWEPKDSVTFFVRVQAQKRLAIPKIIYNSLGLEMGGTVEVTIKPVQEVEE